mmetsp:Transcript_20680/g.45918  ORF Transcript_20680/g.45918 Transcript_20680/m.45918 type:complete len:803 (+) Transcript_20680:68-2476(+)
MHAPTRASTTLSSLIRRQVQRRSPVPFNGSPDQSSLLIERQTSVPRINNTSGTSREEILTMKPYSRSFLTAAAAALSRADGNGCSFIRPCAGFRIQPEQTTLSGSRSALRSSPTHSLAAGAARRRLSTLEMVDSLSMETALPIQDASGEILSVTSTSSSSFVVIKVCEEDVSLPDLRELTADGIGSTDGTVPIVEEDKVELADALFRATKRKSEAKKSSAGGDLTGRLITLPNNARGTVVAHRHPIAFVLVDNDGTEPLKMSGQASISKQSTALNPASVPIGSAVDYLGRQVSILSDGSVSRSLPKASTPGLLPEINIETGFGVASGAERPIFVPIPKISEIGLIDSPLVTGITAIDALTPIGKGQNMLVIGQEESLEERSIDKRGWMLNLMKNVVDSDAGKNIRCFYGLTSGDPAVKQGVLSRMDEAGLRDEIVTVLSSCDSSGDDVERTMEAAEGVCVAAAACTLGEHHALTTGGDSLVVIDDIKVHKSLWDITTKSLVSVYGVDAVVKADLQGGSSSEMRGYFSGIIQRAARFNAKKGGGSVTLVLLSTLPNSEENSNEGGEEQVYEPSDFDAMSEKIKARIAMLVKASVALTPANLAKIEIPVPRPSEAEDKKRLALQHVEDLISMSDGQVWLDGKLAKDGRSPPLDPSRSITRVGVGADTRNCRADAPALRSLVGSLRFEFQQSMDMIDASSSAGEGNAKQIQRRDAFLLAMHQRSNEKRKLSEECVGLLAASRGYLDNILRDGGMPGTSQGVEAMQNLLNHVNSEAGEVLASIDDTLDITEDGCRILEEAISSHFE